MDHTELTAQHCSGKKLAVTLRRAAEEIGRRRSERRRCEFYFLDARLSLLGLPSMSVSAKLVKLNCWKAKGRWHFDLLPLERESFMSALQFTADDEAASLEGCLPLKVNVSGRMRKRKSEAVIEWADGDRTVVKLENIERVYWDHISGNGHTEKDISNIRNGLAT